MSYYRKRKAAPEGKQWYSVGGTLTISIHTTVLASSPEEAREHAKNRGMMSLCHQCAYGEPEEEWVTCGELDGEPEPYDGETELEVVELD